MQEEEVVIAARKLKPHKASGPDGLPAEFWKTVLEKGSVALQWGVEFCRECWKQKAVPESWHHARVAMLFKKGDPSDSGNYRPITLLALGYKLFATVLLNCLRKAGVDNALWPTQFGF